MYGDIGLPNAQEVVQWQQFL